MKYGRIVVLFALMLLALAGIGLFFTSVQAQAPENKPPPSAGEKQAGTLIEPAAAAAIFATSQIDDFGYAFIDSNTSGGPSVHFEDISATGTAVSLSDDEVSGAIPIGFSFNFYGSDYSEVYISSNGFVTFLPGQSNGCCTGQELPDSSEPNGLIAGWWEDLNPASGGTIHYQTMGTAPEQYLIVQFKDIPLYGSSSKVNMQFKLFEGADEMEVHYLSAPSDGGGFTAGIENEDGSIGLVYYHGSAALPTPLAVRYYFPPLYVGPSLNRWGMPGSTLLYTETIVNQSGITDSFDVSFSGNAWPTDVSISSTGPIGHEGSLDFTVEVAIPAGAAPGDYDEVTLQVTSTTSPSLTAAATLRSSALSGQFGYIFNPDSNQILVVDTVLHIDTGIVIDTNLYGDFPWRGAISPDGSWLFTSLRYGDRVMVVDTQDLYGDYITVTVGVEPHGIAFSPDGAYAFVANKGEGTVSVIDTTLMTVTATIPVGTEPYSIAASPCLDKLYVTNHRYDHSVSVIDIGTLTVTQVITGFARPWDVVVSPFGHLAYVTNQDEGSIGVIDTASDSLVDTWDIGGDWIQSLDISPDGRRLYVVDNTSSPARTLVVDAFSGELLATIFTSTDDSWDVEVFPEGLGDLAYVTNYYGVVTIIDTELNQVVTTIPVGGYPRGLALFPPRSTCKNGMVLYPSNPYRLGMPGESVIFTQTVVNLTGASDSFDLSVSGNQWATMLSIQNTGAIPDGESMSFSVQVDIPASATTGALDVAELNATGVSNPAYSDTAWLTSAVPRYGFIFSPDDNEIVVVDTRLHQNLEAPIVTDAYGDFPWRGAISPDGSWLFTSLRYGDRVMVVDTQDLYGDYITVTVGVEPHGIAFSPDGAYAFVANKGEGTVSVIDTTLMTVTATIPVGTEPYSIAASPCLGKLYVTNHRYDHSVSVIDIGTLTVTQVITGFARPWDVVVSPFGDRAYVTNQDEGSIGVIDTASDTLVDTWYIGGDWIQSLDVSPDGSRLYVVDNTTSPALTFVVDTETGEVIEEILTTTDYSWDVEIFPYWEGDLAYVTNYYGFVSVIDTHTNQLIKSIEVDGYPRGLALFPPRSYCGVPPSADFTPLTATIAVGGEVAFTNQSSGSPEPEYTWDFGDGSAMSHAVNPAHTFNTTGEFVVTLTAANIFGVSTVTGTVTVYEPVVAAFTPVQITIQPGETVSFTNLSSGSGPLTFTWDFGDGSATSSEVNPSHVYTQTGSFVVTLTAANPYGSAVATGQVEVVEVVEVLVKVHLPLVMKN